MLNDLYDYALVLFDKYQVVASIAIPSAVVAVALKMMERIKNFGGPQAAAFLRFARSAVLLIAVFWIGFLAWRDEHAARIQAEARPPFDVSKLPRDTDGLKKGDVWNNGGMIGIVQ